MEQKNLIIFDLADKNNGQRSRILQKLYGYRDKSNYNYSYYRKGLLGDIDLDKSRKTVLCIKKKKDIAKVTEILNNLKVNFQIARM